MIAGSAPLESFELPGIPELRDLQSYLGRARRLDPDGAVRLATAGGVLQATVAVLAPAGLGDATPWALGVRGLRLEHSQPETAEVMVPTAGVADRLARLLAAGPGERLLVEIPPQRSFTAWAGMTPPRSDWALVEELEAEEFRRLAAEGIAEIREALPGTVGAALTQRVRREVWGRRHASGVPLGTAFALDGLGFLPAGVERIRLLRSGRWMRLSSPVGEVVSRD